MDKKRLAIVMVLSLVVVFAWTYLHNHLRQTHPEWFEQPVTTTPQQPPQTATQTTPPDSGAGAGGASTTAPTTAQATVQQAAPVATQGGLRVVGGDAQPAQLGSFALDPDETSDYPIGLSIDPRGASVASVTLNRFRQDVGTQAPYVYQTPYENVAAELSRALATRFVVIEGQQQPYDLATVTWARQAPASTTQPSAASATYTVELRDPSGQPLLAVDKQYTLLPRSHESLGYEVMLTYTLRNLTSQPLRAELVFNGPTMPPPENQRDIPEVITGHNDDGQVAMEHQPASNFTPDQQPQSLRHATYPLLWSGVLNAYFNAIVGPAARDGTFPIADVQASAPLARTEQGREFTVLTFRTPQLTVGAGQSVSLPMHVYLGPRQRAVLNNDYYAMFPKAYNKALVLTGACGFCTFQWLIDLLVRLLSIFYIGLRDWGLAIIMLVLLVRLLLHPVTKRSQIAMSRMSKMGPEIERLKKKYGDNKEELNKAMMSIYREQGITPILGCLPMLLQMPIWIALWSSLQSTFELRHASFLWGYTWIEDLAQPDRLVAFAPVKLWFFYLDAINLLPIILGVVFYVQMRMQPQPANMTPEQEQQQKMMRWMSLLFPLLLYNGPSGLNLYIATSTAIGIWESKRVRDHIKAQEEAEKRGAVVSDDGPGNDRGERGRGPGGAPRGPKKPEPPKGGISRWLANLQAKAQEIQREVEKKRRDNR